MHIALDIQFRYTVRYITILVRVLESYLNTSVEKIKEKEKKDESERRVM